MNNKDNNAGLLKVDDDNAGWLKVDEAMHRNKNYCPECGKKYTSESDAFCPQCGHARVVKKTW